MLSLFQRKRVLPPSGEPTPAAASSKGLTRPESAASLLATPRRQKLLEHIWQRTSLSRKQFASLYLVPMERYAELVQQFPASENHHHAYPGGMLDHGLEIVAYALKLRQSHLLPAGTISEDQVAQAEAWTAGIAYAALLHDIGKLAVDLHVEYADGSVWHPWHGPIQQPYRFHYNKERQYRLHSAATGLLYTRLLDRATFDWLSGYPELWAALLYVLAGQYEHAGVLGELVVQADKASVARELGGDPMKALNAPRHALQRKLLDGLRYLLKEELKLNQPQASDGWLTQDALWLVSKTASDKLRAHLLSQGIDGIPASNTALFNVLQDHGLLQPTQEGKAIWKAIVTSSTGWSHSFTFLKFAPSSIWENDQRPAAFAGTVRTEPDSITELHQSSEESGSASTADTSTTPATATKSAIDSVDSLLQLLETNDTQKPTEIEATPLSGTSVETDIKTSGVTSGTATIDAIANSKAEGVSGEAFIRWLKHSIQSRKLIINDAKALVHTVADTVYLVSPGLFQRYAQEYPQASYFAKQDGTTDWQWVQKRFEKLHLHRKQNDGLNIWRCDVTGPRKSRRLHGYLLEDPFQLFSDLPANNPYLSLVE